MAIVWHRRLPVERYPAHAREIRVPEGAAPSSPP